MPVRNFFKVNILQRYGVMDKREYASEKFFKSQYFANIWSYGQENGGLFFTPVTD